MTITMNRSRLLIMGAGVLAATIIAAQAVLASMTTNQLLPAADGTYTDWSAKPGSTHYTKVDDTTCNGTGNYVSTSTVGDRDSYVVDLASIPDGATITDIEIAPCASRNKNGQNGSATLDVFYRFDGTDSSDQGSYALSGTTPTELTSTSFNALSHVKGSSSTLEIGALLSDGTKGARLSRIGATLTYELLQEPTNLSATNASASQNNLTWTDNATNEDGFKIERSQNSSSGPFSEIDTVGANVTSYADTGLTADQTYYYRVRAFNTGGNSNYTSTEYAITYSTVPAAPTNLTATALATSGKIDLNWTDNANNEDGLKIERSTDSENFNQIDSVGMNATDYEDTGLTPGTYYYRVRGHNTIGNSDYSNIDSGTVN